MSNMDVPDTVDFHCHLDLCQDMRAAYARCESARCLTLAVTTTPKAFARNESLAQDGRFVRAALGIHPQLVAQRASELSLFEELAPSTRFIGEVGLDAGRRFYSSFERQKLVFERVMQLCARLGDKVISIHSVRTAKQVLDVVEQAGTHRSCVPVLHWFSASRPEIRRALDLGCYFSVNEQMITAPTGQKLLDTVPLSRVLTETDAPFQSGEFGGKFPGDVSGAIRLIARAYGMDQSATAARIRRTAMELLTV
ncbi:MAG: Qat anti-phage system TatD family nuclease QatD [Pseudomonadota bacterium]|nr:Qat anti-phage system TatD family nuclease QatD [Pseudomonadota bacterium]